MSGDRKVCAFCYRDEGAHHAAGCIARGTVTTTVSIDRDVAARVWGDDRD